VKAHKCIYSLFYNIFSRNDQCLARFEA